MRSDARAPAVRLSHVSQRFGDYVAVKGVDLAKTYTNAFVEKALDKYGK